MKNISARNLRSYHEQFWYAENVLTDFLELSHSKQLLICEVGPAEGGALKYFAQKGHHCFGIEFSANRYKNSLILNSGLDIIFIQGDITNSDTYLKNMPEKMDVVICRDVIEHIDRNKKSAALQNMVNLLKPDGKLFISFPPKYSPYAGHQQTAPSFLSKLPFIYSLPDSIYSRYLSLCKTPEAKIAGLLRVKSNRLSIHQFEILVRQLKLTFLKRRFYIVRPAHENRYKLKRLIQPFNSRFLREWLSTGALYCLIKV